MKQVVKITHLYPDHMNIYGDIGNIITLQKRCEWRNIDAELQNVSIGDTLPQETDLYFIGGGQDKDQLTVYQDLLKHKKRLKKQLKEGVAMLAICGGYQLLGKEFITTQGETVTGLGILNVTTKAPTVESKEATKQSVAIRCIGNVIVQSNDDIFAEYEKKHSTIVGFENHSGQTYLDKKATPLGQVLVGYGNNTKDKTEGCVYNNTIGTYLHGSFLPKNPHIADWLITKALQYKYADQSITVKKLDDNEEWSAHQEIIKKLR